MVSLFGNRRAREAPPEPQVDPGQRIYAVGDINGRADLLYRMIEMVVDDVEKTRDARQPHLVFLGNYIGQGPRSSEVMAALMMIEDTLVFEGVAILRGRQEAMLKAFLKDPVAHPGWLHGAGAIPTLTSYDVAPPSGELTEDTCISVADALADCMGDHVEFLHAMKLTYRSGDVVFAHAGMDPTLPVEEQTDATVIWDSAGFLGGDGYPGLRVVHGRPDASSPVTSPERICVDTSAYHMDRLTAVRLDGGEAFLAATR